MSIGMTNLKYFNNQSFDHIISVVFIIDMFCMALSPILYLLCYNIWKNKI